MKINIATTSDNVTLFSGGRGVLVSYNSNAVDGKTNQSACRISLPLDSVQRRSPFNDGARGRAYVNTSIQDYPPSLFETGTKGTLVSIDGDYLTFNNLEDYLGECKIRDAKTKIESYKYGGSKHQFQIGDSYFISKKISIKVVK